MLEIVTKAYLILIYYNMKVCVLEASGINIAGGVMKELGPFHNCYYSLRLEQGISKIFNPVFENKNLRYPHGFKFKKTKL